MTKKATLTIPGRQGDVLLVKTTAKAITEAHREVPRENGAIVVALGETSMHAHVIRVPGVCMLSSEGVSDRMLRVDIGIADLIVEGGELAPGVPRHGAIQIPKGTYRVVLQREWSGEGVVTAHD